MLRKFLVSLITAALVFASSQSALSSRRSGERIIIGTGAVTGVYYSAGGAIAKIVNRNPEISDLYVLVESTGGSAQNVDSVLAGELPLGIVQSDTQHEAWNGLAAWSDAGPQKELRSVFSLHSEAVTLLVRKDAGVGKVPDLAGKTVRTGPPEAEPVVMVEGVLERFDLEDKIAAVRKTPIDAFDLMFKGELDGIFYVVGHPNAYVKEATFGKSPVAILPLEHSVIEDIIKEHPYYSEAVINLQYYPKASNAKEGLISTLGVKATLVTNAQTRQDIVYAVTKSVFEDFAYLKRIHPVFLNITKEGMVKGLTAPIHPGALRYYRESGLIQYVENEPADAD